MTAIGEDTAEPNAALYVLKSGERTATTGTDARELVRENCTSHQSVADIFEEMYSFHFDEKGYWVRCKELGISGEDNFKGNIIGSILIGP